MNRRLFMKAAGVTMSLSLASAPTFAEQATRAEAEVMVKKAVAYLKKNGREKAFVAFSDPKGEFVDRELYVSVFDAGGTNLAHGANPKLVGKNLWDYRDQDGKYPIRECLTIAKTKGAGWTEFKFLNPVTKEIQAKDVYVERYEDLGIWVGAYKH